MPVTPTYPGIYIEELPSTTHTIAAAPTSIAVFVGYTHPFKTKVFRKAILLFSFADYVREFGGLYASRIFDASVPNAVYQFFLNGGSECYVVGLEPRNFFDTVTHAHVDDVGAVNNAPAVPGFTFTAREPTDTIPITITIDHVSTDTHTANVLVTYGSRPPEVYRGVSVIGTVPDFIDTRMASSAYVVVGPTTASSFPAGGASGSTTTTIGTPLTSTPANPVNTFELSHFNDAFATDGDLDKVPIFNLLILPGVTDPSALATALAFSERKQAFLIMDAAKTSVPEGGVGDANAVINYLNDAPKSPNGALYFPYLKTTDPLSGAPLELPPSGYVAGIYARTDTNRGVWKAPAGLETTVLNTTGVVDSGRMNDLRQGMLNQEGVNALRTFPGIGTVVFGARTLVSKNTAFEQWRYVPVRRMALFIEQTLYRNLGWAVFEPNDEPLWIALRTSVENFMLSLFSRGAFQGAKPSEAFLVQCDHSTTTQTDINLGIVNIIVAFAPLKPAEFVIVKIAQLAGQAQA